MRFKAKLKRSKLDDSLKNNSVPLVDSIHVFFVVVVVFIKLL